MRELEFRKSDLLWIKSTREHIRKHNLSPRQVEEVFNDDNRISIATYNERFKVIGKCGRRMITTVLVKNKKKYQIITARDSDKKEREFYKISLN